ncbi:ARM repeat-containing protein [Neocallimastix californiae]|uniref:ARM repeat-containing protein n=1 Tax=Neocallimastix californiae TaxID=1754190 RepID=A0A1Y2E599_9FUNG|nr:ARM repeat-containing protein [Neocallimastix californiae]|eukprot:ORY66743.1 ARM repeat-containing protein [Neocallimastix californiae]
MNAKRKELRALNEAAWEKRIDIKSLKLEKYIAEVVSAIAEAKLKNQADIAAAVEICSLLHQRFTDFSKLLQDALLKQLNPGSYSSNNISGEQKEKEDSARLARQKSVLPLFIELYLVNVFRDISLNKEKEMLVVTVLKKLLSIGKNIHNNIALAVIVMSNYGRELTGIIPQKQEVKEDDKKDEKEDDSSKSETISTKEENKSNDDDDIISVPNEVKDRLKVYISDYCNAVETQLNKAYENLKKMEKSNHENSIAHGKINEERKEKYQKFQKVFENYYNNAKILFKYVNKTIPEFKDDEDDSLGISFKISLNDKKLDTFQSDIWEDEDSKVFYEQTIDLKLMIPKNLLKSKKEKKSENDIKDSEKSSNENLEQASPFAISELELEKILKEKSEKMEKNGDIDEVEPEDEPMTVEDKRNINPLALESILERLPYALNRDAIDQIAVDFCFVNNKVNVPRQRLDLLPYYSRLISTLNRCFPEIGESVINELEAEFHRLQRKGDQMFHEEKIKNIRFIGELTKFRVTPLHVVFHCIQVLLGNFNGFNIDILCSLLETCGRFLYRVPETKVRLGNMLEIMMRKKAKQHIDNRQNLLIENAYYQCNPPEKIIKPAKQRSPIELYIRKMIYEDLGKYTVDRISKQFRKLNWDDPDVLRVIFKVFFKIWKLKYINIHLMSYLVVDLSHYHPDFGVAVVDNTIEDIRIGLEQNNYKHNQRRLAMIKFLGELWIYHMIETDTIFDILYTLVTFGHDQGKPRPDELCPLDAPHDYFRIRLICTLLDTCGTCLKEDSRLNIFLVLFQVYIKTKFQPPTDILFLIQDIFEVFQPNKKLFNTYEEACIELDRLVLEDRKRNEPKVIYDGTKSAPEEEADNDNDNDNDDDDDDDDDDENDDDDDNNDEVINHEEDEDNEDDENENNENEDEILGDGNDEDVVVYNQDDLKPTEEEEEEYKREFHQIMQESLDSRKNERKIQQFDIPIPMGIKKDLRDNNSDSQDDDSEEEKIMLNLYSKSLSVPNDCLFAVSARNQREIERKEQMKLKKLVLNYEEQEEKIRHNKRRMDNRRYYRDIWQ